MREAGKMKHKVVPTKKSLTHSSRIRIARTVFSRPSCMLVLTIDVAFMTRHEGLVTICADIGPVTARLLKSLPWKMVMAREE